MLSPNQGFKLKATLYGKRLQLLSTCGIRFWQEASILIAVPCITAITNTKKTYYTMPRHVSIQTLVCSGSIMAVKVIIQTSRGEFSLINKGTRFRIYRLGLYFCCIFQCFHLEVQITYLPYRVLDRGIDYVENIELHSLSFVFHSEIIVYKMLNSLNTLHKKLWLFDYETSLLLYNALPFPHFDQQDSIYPNAII